MTKEEYNILTENNIMLKQILVYIASRDSPNNDFKEFAMNVVSNLIYFSHICVYNCNNYITNQPL